MIIGHQKIINFFGAAVDAGHLAHAYCFVGESQLGKRTVARQIAADLLQTTTDRLDSNPDFYYIERAEDEKTGKLKKDLAVAQAREIKSQLTRTSWNNGYRVMIINEAELLNEEAGNALLKSLEEPGAKTIIFLLAEDEGRLLPTIRSRVQICYFLPVPLPELEKALLATGVAATDAKELSELSWGRPGRALAMIADPERRTWYETERKRLHAMRGQPFYQKVAALEEIMGKSTSEERDSTRERERLQEVVDLWIVEWRAELIKQGDQKSKMIIEQLLEAKRLLRRTIHPRLLLEQAVLNF